MEPLIQLLEKVGPTTALLLFLAWWIGGYIDKNTDKAWSTMEKAGAALWPQVVSAVQSINVAAISAQSANEKLGQVHFKLDHHHEEMMGAGARFGSYMDRASAAAEGAQEAAEVNGAKLDRILAAGGLERVIPKSPP